MMGNEIVELSSDVSVLRPEITKLDRLHRCQAKSNEAGTLIVADLLFPCSFINGDKSSSHRLGYPCKARKGYRFISKLYQADQSAQWMRFPSSFGMAEDGVMSRKSPYHYSTGSL